MNPNLAKTIAMNFHLSEAILIAEMMHQNRPHLRYHNWNHVLEVLDVYSRFAVPSDAVFMGFIFHDFVYEVGAVDNESRSGEIMFMIGDGVGIDKAMLDRAELMINMTTITHHLKTTREHVAEITKAFADAQGGSASEFYSETVRFMSSDLASLASDWETFVKKQEDIIFEHTGSEIILPSHRTKSADFLVQFLDKPFIYLDEAMSESFEESARNNIRRWFEMTR